MSDIPAPETLHDAINAALNGQPTVLFAARDTIARAVLDWLATQEPEELLARPIWDPHTLFALEEWLIAHTGNGEFAGYVIRFLQQSDLRATVAALRLENAALRVRCEAWEEWGHRAGDFIQETLPPHLRDTL